MPSFSTEQRRYKQQSKNKEDRDEQEGEEEEMKGRKTETYVVRGNVCPEDIIPFLKLALQQLLAKLLNIIRLFISLSRAFSSDTSIVESTISLQYVE
jgi:hypothetical protein